MPGRVIYIKSKDEWNEIANKHEELHNMLVVCFGASYCAPCRALGPKFETLSTNYDDSVLFIKIDIEECSEIADKFNISSVPTTLIIHNCQIVDQIIGADIIGIVSRISSILSV